MEKTILVVDDSPDNIHLVSAILRDHFRVKAATSGEKALAICRTVPQPDLVLLDIIMPGMSGLELGRILGTDPSTSNIKVLYVSSAAEEFAEAELPADSFVSKPVNPALLLSKIRSLIS